ncbi:Alpha-mannosidase [Rhynchospora pubera]|uniref:Alpha-mannosidase n=1 Tax=Rhynchospora pubera TaxID=906938 RepID=A0AAV8HD96_9POAL|nr:Alpha-mannosidase [Rhynchospora pubera]
MPLFSGNRRGFPSTLLPTTSSRRKSPLTPTALARRRPAPAPAPSPSTSFSFFSLGLLLSVLLFFAAVIRYGVPRSSSNPHSAPSLRLIRRPPIPHHPLPINSRGGHLASAPVDLTTKDLYDRIQFLDVDGGAWKQGWPVHYNGDEWNQEKLKVFVVPHSHNDPGWKFTFEEYYQRQSTHILDAIVDSLSKDSRRKFIWEEMSYLQRWWRDASDHRKDTFAKLVKDGQLEIVGGGWVMNDEANSHYFAIIEQMMEGNTWLNETLGFIPKNSWAIDPFGYSATMAYLLRRMGFQNMLIQRTHYELKKELALNQNLEYVWRQSWDKAQTTDIFVHMMPFYSYDIPHTCGPEPAVCCQFDFARTRGFGYEYCPWHIDPVETTQSNVKERAFLLLDQYKKKSTLYRSNTLLVPLGDDFRYVSVDEAEIQFRNYQMLFDYINSHPHFNAEVQFGTLEDYFQTLRSEVERVNYTRSGELGSAEISGFPSLSGDFFTYADRNQDYWSGYYVSRPFFKAVDRILEQTLRAAEMISALVLGYCQRNPCSKLSVNFAHKLTAARRNLALFQHHDGVTGTAKDHVVVDYGIRMHTSLQDLQVFMSRAVEVLLGDIHDRSDPNLLSQFEPEQTRTKYDVQPVHRGIDLREGEMQQVVFFNPLEQTRDQIVMVVVTSPDVVVLDSNGTCLESQILPKWQHDGKRIVSTGKHRLYWRASVPPLGLETYFVALGRADCEKAMPSLLKVSADPDQFSCPKGYSCSKLDSSSTEISNKRYTLTFDIDHGLLKKINNRDGRETVVDEEISMYSSYDSGAYLFKPEGEARPIVKKGGHLIISQGTLVQEAYSVPKSEWDSTPVSHSTRVYSAENTVHEFVIEKEYHVELLGHELDNKELITRFKTNIDNHGIFYSDLNGFQMSRRETYDKIPLQGNYYPMPSLAFLQDSSGNRFSVHSKQSLGAASLKNGWLEIMLDRRLVHDDGRGLGQGVMDNRPINVIFHIIKESNISALPDSHSQMILQPSILSHRVGDHLNYPMHAFISKKPLEKTLKVHGKAFSPLATSLPCDLHIVGLKVPQPLKFGQLLESRFVIILLRRGWDGSYCKQGNLACTNLGDEQVNLYYLFKELAILGVKPTSLNLLHDDMERLGNIEQVADVAQEGNVVIPPMELQAYKFDIQPQQ